MGHCVEVDGRGTSVDVIGRNTGNRDARPATGSLVRQIPMEKEPIQKLIKQCSMGLFDLACKVSGCSTWDLTLPVA